LLLRLQVISVENVGGKVVHTTTSPVEVGAAVTVKVNWARRWDLMQQHSAQHLVTATAIKLFGYQTDAWNLGDELSFLDLEAAAVTAEQLCELETAVNTSIRASLVRCPVCKTALLLLEDASIGTQPNPRPLEASRRAIQQYASYVCRALVERHASHHSLL
jgi:alanyl-tRNA synthetase